MTLGQRLKQARLESGLSQRQLCGDVITRNMLSQIENGTARPSMDTLLYLAGQLHKPVSYFLEEVSVSPNQAVLLQARQAFTQGLFSEALAALDGCTSPDPILDPERYLLEVLCCLAMADQASDPSFLDRAADAGSRTPYYHAELERRRLLLLARMQPENAGTVAAALPPDPSELLLRGDAAMSAGDPQSALVWYSLAEPLSPEVSWPRLEKCHHVLEDYKMAYHYACLQRQK